LLSISTADAFERLLVEGAAAFVRFKEWFLVPMQAIDEAVKRILVGSTLILNPAVGRVVGAARALWDRPASGASYNFATAPDG
jgi:hypothetical protein